LNRAALPRLGLFLLSAGPADCIGGLILERLGGFAIAA
jgi:hypothetical protein